MNIASLFFAPIKDSISSPFFQTAKITENPTKSMSIGSTPSISTNNGFRKIKKEPELSKMQEAEVTPSKISNPFSQALPHTMMKLLQLINPKNTIQNNNTQDPSQKPYSEISKLSAIFESLNSEKDLEYPKQETPQNKIISKVLLVNKASELNKANPSSFLNKNLYVEFLASLYKQNKMQKPNEDNSNMNKTFSSNSSLNANQENFNFSTFKKENSSPNNGSFSHHEESPDSDELSSSNDNLKSKSKKIKKVNLLCGHYAREHYAKNLCNNCYHKYGRTKKPWNCCHEKLYAHGLCQNCYINKYNQTKKNKIKCYDIEKMENEEVKGLEEEKDNSKFEESKECQEYPIKDEAENN